MFRVFFSMFHVFSFLSSVSFLLFSLKQSPFSRCLHRSLAAPRQVPWRARAVATSRRFEHSWRRTSGASSWQAWLRGVGGEFFFFLGGGARFLFLFLLVFFALTVFFVDVLWFYTLFTEVLGWVFCSVQLGFLMMLF